MKDLTAILHGPDAVKPFMTGGDVSQLVQDIDQMIDLLGIGKVKKAVASWELAIKNSSGLVREYHRNAFYWWPALRDYLARHDLLRAYPQMLLASEANHIVRLGQGARNFVNFWGGMPPIVRNKYGGTLVDIKRAPAHVFELSVAWHFKLRGMEIGWCEDDENPIAEFIVTTPSIVFDVECKEFLPDKGRRINRLDFCRLADIVALALKKKRLMGHVAIELEGKLPREHAALQAIAKEIVAAVAGGARHGTVRLAGGDLTLELCDADDREVDHAEVTAALNARKTDNALACLVIPNNGGPPANPLTITVSSRLADSVMDSFLETLKDAAGRQVSGERPALLFAYLPEVADIQSLTNSALGNITNTLFSIGSRSHVAAVIFSSFERAEIGDGTIAMINDSLCFPNMNCRFQEVAESGLLQGLLVKGVQW